MRQAGPLPAALVLLAVRPAVRERAGRGGGHRAGEAMELGIARVRREL